MDARKLSMKLHIGRFALLALEQRASDASSFVQEAAAYYLSDLEPNRPGRRHPRFPPGDAQPLEIDLTLTASQCRKLEEEAEEQGISVEQLLEHAVLYYLADLDSGRAARRLLSPD